MVIKKILIFTLLVVLGLFVGINRKVVNAVAFENWSYYETNNQSSPYIIYSQYFPIEDHSYAEIYIPNLSYFQDGIDGYTRNDIVYESTISFVDENYQGKETIPLSIIDEYRTLDWGTYIFPTGLSDIYQVGSEPKYFLFNLAFPWYSNMNEVITFLEDNFAYAFDEEIEYNGNYEIKYIVDGEIYLHTVDNSTLTIIPPTPLLAGLFFVGWYDSYGVLYEYDRNLFDLNENGTIFLFSGWSRNNPINDPDIPDPNIPETINYFLYIKGWNSTGAKILIFVIISVILVLGGIAIKLPTFTHVMVNMLIGGLFIFMQWLPLYIAIPLIMIQIVILIYTVKGGRD